MKKYQYRAIHTAVRAVWGKPKKCELCHGKNKAKRFEWSNKDHKYSPLKKDWRQLCSICHRRYDRAMFGYITWNKGLRGRQSWHNIKGLNQGIPWNKGKKEKRQEIIKKLRKSHLGKTPWNKGIKYKQKRNR